MAQKFQSIVTLTGQARIAAAVQGGGKTDIITMVVGDGNGAPTVPAASQTHLVNEVWRVKLNSLKVDAKNKNWLIAEAIAPASVGGFWMRELGLLASDGSLMAVCNMAETYKPTLDQGSGRTQTLRMVLSVTDTSAVTLLIDDSISLATEEYVNDRLAEHEQSRNHPDATLIERGFAILSSTISEDETRAATPKAVKAANDNANGRVPASRKVNGLDLTSDINLGAASVGAYTKAETDKQIAVAKAAADNANTNANGRVPMTRKVNGRELYADIEITAGDVGAIPDGSISGGPNAPAWDAKSGMYNLSLDGASQMIFHLNQGVGSCPAAQIRFDYKNRGIWYRTARDKFGFEADWSGFYTTTNKPSAGDVGALSLAGGAMGGSITGVYTESAAWADQFRTKAPFFDDYTSTAGSAYRPVIKQRATTTGNSWAFSMGTLLNGGALSWHLHIRGSSGLDINHRWATDGNYYAANQLIPANYTNFDGRYQLKNTASLSTAGGWQQDSSTGLIIQMGTVSRTGYSTAVNFPKAFPNFCMGVVLTLSDAGTGSLSDSLSNIRSLSHSKTGFTYGSNGDPEKKHSGWHLVNRI